MGARTLLQIGALAVALSCGCTLPYRVVRTDGIPPADAGKSAPAALDNAVPPGAPKPPDPPAPGVVPAAGAAPVAPQPPTMPPTPGVPTLPPPRVLGSPDPALPAAPTGPTPQTGPGAPAGPAALPPGVVPGPPLDFGPHVRATPTVGGKIYDLAPNEFPLDRLGEFARRSAELEAEKARLTRLLVERDALGVLREQAMEESRRAEADANDRTAKAKIDTAAAQAEAAAARARVTRIEAEDVEFLRALADALGELVNPPKGNSP